MRETEKEKVVGWDERNRERESCRLRAEKQSKRER